jgi:N-methylhydantoinase A
MDLDTGKAKEGLTRKISSKIGLSAIEIALAITKIAVMNMSLAVRGISVERGYDPRDFVLLSFGGAGPLHSVEVAHELHIPTVIVPNYPSHFCALGMLMADIKHDYVRTYYKPFEQADFREMRGICRELIDIGAKTLESEAVLCGDMIFQRFLDIRYSGQEFSIPVPVHAEYIETADTKAIRRVFEDIHDRRYGYHATDQSIEIVNVRLVAVGKRKPLTFPSLEFSKEEDPLIGKRRVYLDHKEAVECSIYGREKLTPGYKVIGPAIIQEYASTTVLFPGDRATVTETGELVINIRGDE